MASNNRSPEASSHRELVHYSSSSSEQSGNSPHLSPRNRPRSNRQPARPTPTSSDIAQAPTTDEPSTISPGEIKSQGSSRRPSAASMRHSSIPLEAPLTYTPTTHRVSKAKKGKRVHACEFPGCNKVFTRAEHRRRHELNHNPEASYACDRDGCRKAFHRLDLLQRHQERHDLDAQSEGTGTHRRHPSQLSMSSEATSAVTTASMNSPSVPIPSSGPHSSVISILSMINPPSGGETHLRANGPSFDGAMPNGFLNFVPLSSSDESWSGYSHERSQSPVSDCHPRFTHSSSISSSPSIADMYSNMASPLVRSTMGGWEPIVMPPTILPSSLLGPESAAFSSIPEPSLPLPLSDLDGHEWLVIRRELSSGPSIVPGDDGHGIFDTVRWQDCLEHYWRHFHPLFPVVHRPTFFATKPSPLMASAMVAIGSQYDNREDAKEYSLALLEAATQLLSKRDSINSRSRLTDLQTVFLLEVLSKYRSRRASVQVSPRFRSFYASLTQARHWISTNPLAVFTRLRKDYSPEDLANAHKFWTERETRRRILQASFILDTQQAILFEQQPAMLSLSSIQTKNLENRCEMPLPCEDELWESSPIEEWVSNAAKSNNMNLSTTAHEALSDNPPAVDMFSSRLILSYVVTVPEAMEYGEEAIAMLERNLDMHGSPSTCFSLHALLTARHTPVRQLLTVSGETWLFGKKVDSEVDFLNAKHDLRQWVDDTRRSLKALWHATKLLRHSFDTSPQRLFDPDHPNHSDRRLNMLHEEWSIYLAALVCWAVGFDASQNSPSPDIYSSAASSRSDAFSHSSSSSGLSVAIGHPPLLDPADADEEMRTYLNATEVANPEALAVLDVGILGRTDGLLEVVRTRRLAGPMGELLNEAERVLYRLVEAKSRIAF